MLSKAHFPAYTSLGLMGMTWRADQISNEQAFAVMRAASASGATLWSTADFYGTTDPLAGIRLVGRYFKKYPHDAFNISVYVKGCIDPTTMQPDNSPEATRKSVESVRDALGGAKNVDIIFGPARVDPNVPIEDTMEELEELVDECKISGVGLSEVGPETIRRAHACMPLALVEVEFSLWSTEFLTNGVAATTKELDIPVLAYSPLGRGFFTGQLKSIQDIPAGDMRLSFDRFQPENFEKNLVLVNKLQAFVDKKGVTLPQLSLAWILSYSKKGNVGKIVPIPGATTVERVQENTTKVELTAEEKAEIDAILDSVKIAGGRYNQQLESTLWG